MSAAPSSSPFFGLREEDHLIMSQLQPQSSSTPSSSAGGGAHQQTAPQKKKRNLPGTPYPDAEVIALSPKTLMATNRFICEVCNKGFQREQNLQLHRRGHNLPWKLKQKNPKDPVRRRVYVCPEASCVHHDPSRALGDLTGIKKHFSRKHGEKKWKCDKCAKRYAVQSDWKAHSKVCGTREYRCDCGTLFSRRDSFITHRAFCDALAQESARIPTALNPNLYGSNNVGLGLSHLNPQFSPLQDQSHHRLMSAANPSTVFYSNGTGGSSQEFGDDDTHSSLHGLMQFNPPSSTFDLGFSSNNNFHGEKNQSNTMGNNQMGSVLPQMSATALLQKAAQMGSSTTTGGTHGSSILRGYGSSSSIGLKPPSFSGEESLRSQMENETNLQGIMNSLSNDGSGVFDSGGRWNEMGFSGFGGGFSMDESKLDQSLTRDFLGVGSMVRSIGGGGINSQREEHSHRPFTGGNL